MSLFTILLLAVLAAGAVALWYYLQPVGRDTKAHGLTLLCPIKNGQRGITSFYSIIRDRLEDLPRNEDSPFARVPNTYLCRAFVLNDVFFEGGVSVAYEHLRSKYLVFTSNYHGDLDEYLCGMWKIEEAREIWADCVGFENVSSAESFVKYIKECQVETTFYFNGSTDQPVEEQLKALYLKQELSKFAFANQGKDPAPLQRDFQVFIDRVKPDDAYPRWVAGSPHGEVETHRAA